MKISCTHYWRKAFVILCLFLLFSTNCIALEPQSDIKIVGTDAIYDVTIPLAYRTPDATESATLQMPVYLQQGLVTDTNCQINHDKTGIYCVKSSNKDNIQFHWDLHAIYQDKYCTQIAGTKSQSAGWIAKYTFVSDSDASYAKSLVIDNLQVDNGTVGDTYADISSINTFGILWSFGQLTPQQSSFTFADDASKPYIGAITDIHGKPISLYVVNRYKKPVSIDSTTLQICSVADLTTQSFKQPVTIVYKDVAGKNAETGDDLATLYFTYNVLSQSQDVVPTTTPTQTPTPTVAPSATPTLQQIQISSTPPTPTSTPTLTVLLSNQSLSTNEMGSSLPTATPQSIDDQSDRNRDDKQSITAASLGKVLGASALPNNQTKSNRSQTIYWLLAVIGLLVITVVLVRWRHKACHLKNILFIIIWLGLACEAQAAPMVLGKITNATSYYARSMGGWGELVKTAPLFYFEGVKPGGKVMISSTTDGTGRINLGNGGNFIRTLTYWSSSVTFAMTNPPASSVNCNAGQDLPPQELPAQYFNTVNTDYALQAVFRGYCPRATPWQVSDLYLVYLPPAPSATPTVTPTPTPTVVMPFLDLPWDYKGEGLTFTEAALAMSSYFDHEYPFLSTNMSNPDYIMRFLGDRTSDLYSSHDGYDYANIAKAHYGDPQYAAAGGEATFRKMGACGNMILIDHGNGYQTRYCHLDPDGLILSEEGKSMPVVAGQQIGKIGFTGNVDPAGSGGAHIHFMVVFDKNADGNFDDNIPDGLVDPYGWQGTSVDPWQSAKFKYQGIDRTGMKSSYLWKTPITETSKAIGPAGGDMQSEKVNVSVPANILSQWLDFYIRAVPRQKIDDSNETIGSVADITAVDGGGIMVKAFIQPFAVSFNYNDQDISNYNPDTLSIYSSPDGAIWQKEQTLIDQASRMATAYVNHLSYFALVGMRQDMTAPSTSALLAGVGQHNVFRSVVRAELSAIDNLSDNIEYSLYQLDQSDWTRYIAPIDIAGNGVHTLRYFSADNYGNVENHQTVTITIDTTIPEIYVDYDRTLSNFRYDSSDPEASIDIIEEASPKQITVEDPAGNKHSMSVEEKIGTTSASLIILNHQYNSLETTTSDYYQVVNDGDSYFEYLQSAGAETRVIHGDDDKTVTISPDGQITESQINTPLQLVTDNAKLKIHDQ